VACIKHDGKNVEFLLWDTGNMLFIWKLNFIIPKFSHFFEQENASQDVYDRLRELRYPNTDAIVLCFSIDSPDSLENIQLRWIPELKKFCPKVPIILVGTKSDLRNDATTKKNLMKHGQEPVSGEQGRMMANLIGADAYLECSAKINEGVLNVFETATRASLDTKRKRRK
jgi:Ras family protein A